MPDEGISPEGTDLVVACPRGELDSEVGVDDSAGGRLPVFDRHIERVDDQG